MHIMGEVAIIFGICLLSEGISAILPFVFPASVISMVVLLLLLFSGIIKERHIERIAVFFLGNMAFFFLPACVGVMEHLPSLANCLLPFLFIAAVTTPLVYAVTAWVIQLMMRRRKGGIRHD